MNKRILQYTQSLLAVSLLTFINCAFADDTQVGLYMTVNNKPKAAQIDLLSQTIQLRFKNDVQTIGDAMNYILKFSGYTLVPTEKMSSALKTTLAKPLPAIDRDFGPMSMKDGLTTLAGPAFYLVQDPLNRMVDFRVKPQFLTVYSPPNLKQKKNTKSLSHTNHN